MHMEQTALAVAVGCGTSTSPSPLPRLVNTVIMRTGADVGDIDVTFLCSNHMYTVFVAEGKMEEGATTNEHIFCDRCSWHAYDTED